MLTQELSAHVERLRGLQQVSDSIPRQAVELKDVIALVL